MQAPIQVEKKIVNQSSETLVLFDFDGTITTKDTLEEFIIFYRGKFSYYTGLIFLSPILFLYKAGLIANWKAKEYFLAYFLKGEDFKIYKKFCDQFAKERIPLLVRPAALEQIKKFKNDGATIAVVTASADWVKPWCEELSIECLSTSLEVKENKLTGKINGKNCHGAEKACRIREHFSLTKFSEIIAYGDTSGDREMLAMAHHKYYKPFRK